MIGATENFQKIAIRVAVIGSGYWGRNLVRNFANLGALSIIFDSHTDTPYSGRTISSKPKHDLLPRSLAR